MTRNTSLKTALSACAMALLCMSVAVPAAAQGRGNDRDHRDSRGEAHGQRHDDRRDGHRDARRDEHRDDRDQRARRGAGPDYRYYVGNRLPAQYRQRSYVVDNWRVHQLRQPPRGYHWVQNGSDYLLVAIATGVIANIILNN